jgi:omega-hydroxy-beta-dihydromenaquinone-9 sulfotransferase
MRFYESCLKRQAYTRGKTKVFLSKNPVFCGKIASLHTMFPDARFVYLVRNPLEAIPSMISEGHATCVYAARGSHPSPAFQELVYDVARIYYRYPLSYLDSHASGFGMTVRFDELVTNPLDTVTGLYNRLGYGMTPAFRGILEAEQAKSRAYRSVHRYTLEQFGIPAERIVRDLDDVFTRFGFARTVNSPAVSSPDGVTSERAQRSNP